MVCDSEACCGLCAFADALQKLGYILEGDKGRLDTARETRDRFGLSKSMMEHFSTLVTSLSHQQVAILRLAIDSIPDHDKDSGKPLGSLAEELGQAHRNRVAAGDHGDPDTVAALIAEIEVLADGG